MCIKTTNLKDAGYDKLAEKLREIEDADSDMVNKNINGLRTDIGGSWKESLIVRNLVRV